MSDERTPTDRSGVNAGGSERFDINRRETLKALASASLLPGLAATSGITAGAASGTIVDNSDSGATITGSWTTSTYSSNYVGSNYLHDDNAGKGSKSVEFTPDLPAGGPYNVFLYWNSSPDRATSVPVDVDYDGGSTTVTVDQTANGGQWNHVGTHQFASGTGGSVTIRNDGTSDYVIADAVQFAPAVVDSEDSSGVSITGTWTDGTGVPGYQGSNYKHDGDSGKGSKSVAFSPAIPGPGTYEVFLNWTSDANRASNVPVDVQGPNCTATVTVDQTANGGQWNSLGEFKLDSNSTITIRNDGTNGYVVADAVKIEWRSESSGGSGSSGTPEVLVNQAGYDTGRPKRFTAPGIADGTSFDVVDQCSGTVQYTGTVSGEIGDFSDFDPTNRGPYEIELDSGGTTLRSLTFEIAPHLTELRSYRNAVEFFTGSRTEWGDYSALPSTDSSYPVSRGVAWRDQDGYSFILRTLADLYLSNPRAMETITVDSSDVPSALPANAYQYAGMPTSVPADTPEVVRLLWWGAHVYLKAGVNYSLMKTELAAFLRVYPEVSEWIPQSLYDDVYNHLFPIWDQATGDKHYVSSYYYTDHSKDLTTTYTQVGTSKGEFPPGFSVRGNLDMYEVAQREGRGDAQDYLDAAVAQVDWIVNNLDVTDPMSHKGQRMSEHVTLTGVARLVAEYPNEAPSGTWDWIASWATQMVSLSDNLWDFRKWDATTWISQQIPSYPSENSINEPGNVAGFPAPTLAAANVLDEIDGTLADDLRRIAQAHVDNTFGRNPTGRHFSHRAPTTEYGFEGVERGWYSEYNGIGQLNGVRGVLDGSPKNDHYPNNPGAGDIGWTEGWVAFNSAWNAGLSWLSFDDSALAIGDSNGNDVDAVGSTDTITLSLRIAIDNESSTQETVDVELKVGSQSWETVTLTQVTSTSSTYEATVDLGTKNASNGDDVRVRYGAGVFTRSDWVPVGSADTTAPTVPSNLSSPAQTSTSIDLDWDASSDSGGSGLDHYDVYKDGTKDSQVAAGTTSATVTGLSAGTSYDFHVTAVDGAGNESSASGTVTVSTSSGSSTTIVDSEDSTGVTITGSWTNSTWESGYQGSNYKHDGDTGKGSKSVALTPDLDSGGNYEVYLNWTSGANRATNVPVDVDYDGGTDTVTVDQTANGGTWQLLGTYAFTSGTGETVTIRNDGTNGYVIADAVRFVPV